MAIANKVSVCLLDDDKVFGFTFSKYLELIPEAGALQVFRTAREALNFYEEWKDHKQGLPDILMIDINPPAKTGWKFLESLSGIWNQLNRHPAIYMISSTPDPDDKGRAENHPLVTQYLVKPLGENLLKKIIEQRINE